MLATSLRLAVGYTSMLVHATVRRDLLRRADVRAALVRQVHVTGVQAVPFVLIVALLFGGLVVTRALAMLGPDNDYALHGVVRGGIRELGPTVTALIVIARSSVAIAAEVALMQLRSGIHDDVWQDAAHEEEVVLPRVLGVAAASAMLVAYFQSAAIGASLLSTAWTQGTSLEVEVERFLSATHWLEVPLAIIKGAIMGGGIAAIACYHGLHVRRQISEVPKAVVATCVGSVVYVMVVDTLSALSWLI